jgi:hypothetical protein
MHPLFTSSFRRKILKISIIIAIPAVILLIYIEAGLSRLDTHYLKKRLDFNVKLSKVEVLSLGSSNAYFGINPKIFSCNGYNLAYNAQSMYYDLEFIKKYIDLMPELKIVILPAIFYTTGTRLVGTSQDWRMFFYKQYWGLPLENEPKKITENIKRHIDSRNYTKIALYSDTLYTHLKDGFSGHVDYIPEESGWYNSKDAPKFNAINEIGRKGAEAHSLTYDTKVADKNIKHWQKLIDILKNRGVEVILVHLPEDKSYYNYLDQKKSQDFTARISGLARKNGIKFADYSKDRRFNQEDYTFMPDHLNDRGASKFSGILNSEYLQDLCAKNR